MITRSEAERLAKQNLDCEDWVLLNDPIAEGDYGWVFGYQSAEYLKSGDFRDMLLGNAPFLVEKETGQVFVLGTAHPLDHYIQNFLSSGDPHQG